MSSWRSCAARSGRPCTRAPSACSAPATAAGRTTEEGAMLLQQFTAELVTGRPAEGARHVEQLRALAERSGAPEIRLYERFARGLLQLPGETADALTSLTEAERMAEK